MKTLEEIQKIRELKRLELDLRVNTKADTREKHILVCHGTGCTSSKSPKIIERFREILKEKNIDNVRVIQTGTDTYKISSLRQPSGESYKLKAYMVVRKQPSGKWLITEEMMQTKVQMLINAK